MRTLFFLVFFWWVFPSEYQAYTIPLPNAILVHGEPRGFPSTAPLHREKRAKINCSSHEYRPRRNNHCCNKCIRGHKVEKDCTEEGKASKCIPCDEGTFMDIPNNSKYCQSCSTCMPQYGQITLSECTTEQDTQCGCPEEYFKQFTGSNFICQKCTTCLNGTEYRKCHDDKDTICKCFLHFFFDLSETRCRPCSECHGPDCKDHCPTTGPTRKQEESNGVLTIALGVVTGVFFAAVGTFFVYTFVTRRHSSSTDTEDTSSNSTLLIKNQENSMKDLLSLPGYTKVDNPSAMQLSANPPSEGPLPLPDVTKGTAPPGLNRPEVMYTIIESIPLRRWIELVRRLGLSNNTIETCEQDHHRHYRDAQYAMLNAWISQEGSLTSKRDQLFTVLREIHLGGCIDKIEEHLVYMENME